MKKFIFALVMLFTMTVSASAMSYEEARNEALFLTDKMAYELNLTEDQYEAAYEINLDYLMRVNTVDDLYGTYWRYRNLDMSYILFDWQYRAFCDAAYFYRPIYWSGIKTEWYKNLEIMRTVCMRHNLPFWTFALATPHTTSITYPTPTIEQLRLQLYTGLAYGSQGLQYFTFWCPPRYDRAFDYHEAPISDEGVRTHVYELTRTVNREIQNRAFVFLDGTVEAVNHLGEPLPEGTHPQVPIICRFLRTRSQNLRANVSGWSAWIAVSLQRKYLTIWK